jgi:hypothetical protein
MRETAVERGTKILAGRYRQGLGAAALLEHEIQDDGATNDRLIAELARNGHQASAMNTRASGPSVLGPENLLG